MTTVTLGVSSLEETKRRTAAALRGEHVGAFISFETPELLWQVLTPNRWQVLRTLAGEDELAVREVARRLGRDVKAVHNDLTALAAAGIIERTEGGHVHFPYDTIHVDYMLTAAA